MIIDATKSVPNNLDKQVHVSEESNQGEGQSEKASAEQKPKLEKAEAQHAGSPSLENDSESFYSPVEDARI